MYFTHERQWLYTHYDRGCHHFSLDGSILHWSCIDEGLPVNQSVSAGCRWSRISLTRLLIQQVWCGRWAAEHVNQQNHILLQQQLNSRVRTHISSTLNLQGHDQGHVLLIRLPDRNFRQSSESEDVWVCWRVKTWRQNTQFNFYIQF